MFQQILTFLALVAVAYLVICGLAFVLQEKLVFFPDRNLVATPRLIGLAHDEVRFATTDGLELSGWFIPHPESRATLLFFHGNAGNISHRLESIEIFHALRLDIFIFDYRGYGSSDGRPTETGTYRDAAAAWRYLTTERGVAPEHIVFFGRSLGGAVAAELATRHLPLGLILESTFTTIADLGAAAYPFLPVRQLARLRYDTASRIRTLTCPKLIIHSADDELVPYRFGQALYAAAAPPKSMLTIHGDHNNAFLISGNRYFEGLEGFLDHLEQDVRQP